MYSIYCIKKDGLLDHIAGFKTIDDAYKLIAENGFDWWQIRDFKGDVAALSVDEYNQKHLMKVKESLKND